MNEKIVVQTKNTNAPKIRNVIWVSGIIVGILAALLYADSRKSVHNTVHFPYSEGLDFFEYIAEYPSDLFGFYGFLFFSAAIIVALIVGIIFYRATHKIELTVSDKRVYGIVTFGKRVDLPLDSVSSVGTSVFNSITVATSSGRIRFFGIENRNEIHKALSVLLIDRQNKPATVSTAKQETSQSNADEIKKYKELLDSGVITQEEYDAKKKQLLGL